MKHPIYTGIVKRMLDIFLALAALTALAPTLLILAVLVRAKLGSPVLFRQPRPGKDERVFTLYKFRTMTDQRDAHGRLLPDRDRLTGFGRYLRAASLDELPELFNILKGDMSVVGPRPLLVDYLRLYSREQRRRHAVRPGLTGWAQVNGRNALSWDKKLRCDVEYVDRVSFWLDVRIVWKTFRKVLLREGVCFANRESIYTVLTLKDRDPTGDTGGKDPHP